MEKHEFDSMIELLDKWKEMGHSKGEIAHAAIGCFESITNMTEEQVSELRLRLYGW